MYPNPAKEQVSIFGEGIESIAIFDMRGQKVAEKHINATPLVVSLEGLQAFTPSTWRIKTVLWRANC